MISCSNFEYKHTLGQMKYVEPISADYKVFVDGKEVPVYTCRISKYPFNTWWPGHQRQIDQSEKISYINLVSDEELQVEIEPLTKENFKKI